RSTTRSSASFRVFSWATLRPSTRTFARWVANSVERRRPPSPRRWRETVMGYETKCRARVDDGSGKIRDAESTVLLETDELIVRGEARSRIQRSSTTKLASRSGVLTIPAPTAVIALSLGDDAAAKWKKKLEEPPKQLIDKLDVKPDARVWLLGVDD